MRLDHVANRVTATHFDTVVDLMVQRLGFVEVRRVADGVWLRQPGTNVELQFSTSTTVHRDEDRLLSQVSFLSDTPREDLEALAAWASARGMPATVGAYSDREFYLDAPDAFVDFVLEALLPRAGEDAAAD